MTTRRQFVQALAAFAVAGAVILGEGPASAQNPSASPEELARATVARRAIEAIVWGMPAVNADLMYQAMVRETKGRSNQVVYWSRLLDWKNQTLTPNTDVVYLMPFFNTKDVGPIVIEIPAADDGVINGTIMDVWQTPLEDVGPAGADRGKGAKYLILPTRYKGKVPNGYITLPSLNYQGYALLRSLLKSGSEADLAKAVAYGKRIKVYPLSQAANQAGSASTTFVDASGVLFDATIPYDVRFFESLNRVVQVEPWLQRDRAMIDTLRSVGIEKGKPFNPDPEARTLFDAAAARAHALLDAELEGMLIPPFVAGSRWAFPASPTLVKSLQSGHADPNVYPIDARGVLFTFVFFTPKRLGEGQFYLMTVRDKAGEMLDGGRNYRLTVPANAPVRQYWSVTVYDRATHALIRNLPHAGRSSQSPGLQKSADGSVELDFGPKAQVGRESNWVPTSHGGKFEVLVRFYAPEKPLFEKTWVLPDIEEVK